MKALFTLLAERLKFVVFCLCILTIGAHAGGVPTNGYITAVLRSGCADAPTPPPVGSTIVGSNYVIMTVADGNPADFMHAREIVTDEIFESLMPLYCNLPKTTNNCVENSVQWGIMTYDVNGNPHTSGCAASGCEYRSCAGFESGPPEILVQPPDRSVNSGQTATFGVVVFGSMPLHYQWIFNRTNILVGATNSMLVLPNARTNDAGTYEVQVHNALGNTNSRPATLTVNPGPAATNGYITAMLRSGCADAPTPPPPVGSTIVGSNYVIMTVADGNPADFMHARKIVTDEIFESLMPLYCNLPRTTNNCVEDSVQWGIMTYDVNGNPHTSGCAASGCEYRSCGAAGAETHAPVLKISSGNTNVGVSWSTMASDFVLETSTDMVNWQLVDRPATTNFEAISVQIPPQGDSPYFRLRRR